MSRSIAPLVLVLSLASTERSWGQAQPALQKPLNDRCACCVIPSSRTYRQEIAEAAIVLDGTLANPTLPNPAGDEKTAVTDLRVLTTLKTDPALQESKVVAIGRYVAVPNPKKPPRMLVFFEVTKGKVEAYRGIPITSDAVPKYLKAALKLDPKKLGDAIVFFQRHLDSPDLDVVQDAYRELVSLSYADIRRHAAVLPADAIAARLKNEKSPYWLRYIDGLLLGHCGTAKHAKLLEEVTEARCKAEDHNGLEGLLIGHVLLRPREGLAQLRKIMSDGKSAFLLRYQALKALRFLNHHRPDLLKRSDIIGTISLMLEQPDMADFVIDDLRRLGDESALERILSLYGKKDFEVPVIRRAIIRFALTMTKHPKAAQFIEQRRAEDAVRIEEIEEALKQEQ